MTVTTSLKETRDLTNYKSFFSSCQPRYTQNCHTEDGDCIITSAPQDSTAWL